jgi:hypothetical protein
MDGITVKVKKSRYNEFIDVCKQFKDEVVDIKQEYNLYKSCYIKDVNNYHITMSNGYIKRKGVFELPQDKDPHKNNSSGIVSIAVDLYIRKGIPFMDTIVSHISKHKNGEGYIPKVDDNGNTTYEIVNNGIYDFCNGVRARTSAERGKAHFEFMNIVNGKLNRKQEQKVVRYYVSKSGGKLIKCYEDGTESLVVADKVYNTVVNDMTGVNQFDVDYKFYEKQCIKLIKSMDKEYLKKLNRNLTLF